MIVLLSDTADELLPCRVVIRDLPGLRKCLILIPLALGCVVLAASAQPTLEFGLGYNGATGGAPPEIVALVAQRYSLAHTSPRIGEDGPTIKALNPDFKWFFYNSATDNYIGMQYNDEEEVVNEIAGRHGWNPEEEYLHYYDDTQVTLQGELITIPGWGGGSAVTEAEARVPVYYSNLSRRAVNFSTPEARQLTKETILATTVDRVFDGTDLHPDGIFLDNSSYKLANTGTVISGGHVLEAPGHQLIASNEFQAWFWNEGFAPFLEALKDTLETSASWSPTGERLQLMLNIATNWTDSYGTKDVADILTTEWQYDPVRNAGKKELGLSWQRDLQGATNGIRSFSYPLMQRAVPGVTGEISYGDAILGSLSWDLINRNDGSLLYLYGGAADITEAGWDTLTWRGCVDVARDQLGHYTAPPFVFAEGTDPTGKAYRVWGRSYEHGLVLARNRGTSTESFEAETAVTIPLPGPLSPLDPSGSIGPATQTATLRNGMGKIFLGSLPAGWSPPAQAPSAYFRGAPLYGIAPLTVDFADASLHSPTSWLWKFGDGATSTEQNPTHTYTTPGQYMVRLTVTNAQGSDQRNVGLYVTVLAPPTAPTADFLAGTTSGVIPLAVDFTDLSSGIPTNWSWSFGDGASAQTKNPMHTYTAPGVYTVTLTASNAAGSDVEAKVGYITVTGTAVPPVAAFTGNPTAGTVPLAVHFTDQSTNNPTTWSWTFGDGGSSTQRNPDHTYTTAGSYTVTLTVGNSAGTNTLSRPNYVSAQSQPAGADLETPRPPELALEAPHPNPFSREITMGFSLPSEGFVRLTISGPDGRCLAVPAARTFSAGTHVVTWQAHRLPAGVFYCRLFWNGQVRTRSVIHLN